MLLSSLGRLANQRELVDLSNRGAAHRPVNRLPARAVIAQTSDDVCGRSRLAIRSHSLDLENPAVAIAGEVAFAVAALGVEDPGLELALPRVPPDPLRAA